MTNYDKTYLDCGFGAQEGRGHNWCAPYKGERCDQSALKKIKVLFHFTGWQAVYENDIYALLSLRDIELTDKVKEQLLGGEVAIWTEQVNYEQPKQ